VGIFYRWIDVNEDLLVEKCCVSIIHYWEIIALL